MQVHIQCAVPEGGTSWFVRVPCFLSAVSGSDGDEGTEYVLRDRIYGRILCVLCAPGNIRHYESFLYKAFEAAEADSSLFFPSGELYAAVMGTFMGADDDRIIVRTDVPGGGFGFGWAHDGH